MSRKCYSLEQIAANTNHRKTEKVNRTLPFFNVEISVHIY